jgi:RNA polymerase sigma factor (TIGR02999 family)
LAFSGMKVTVSVTPQPNVTTLLDQIRSGRADAPEQLFEIIREELHRLAMNAMARQRKDHTLQPTALLHEAWIRFFHVNELQRIEDRSHLFQAAARAMRNILIDHSRRRDAGKRGGNWRRVPFDGVLDYFSEQRLDVQAIHEALEDLENLNSQQATIMTLRVIGSFTVQEVAEQLGIPRSRVEFEYRLARAWLHKRLKGMT